MRHTALIVRGLAVALLAVGALPAAGRAAATSCGQEPGSDQYVCITESECSFFGSAISCANYFPDCSFEITDCYPEHAFCGEPFGYILHCRIVT
jgi:hypothetical protein